MNQFRARDAIDYNGWRVNFSPQGIHTGSPCAICRRPFRRGMAQVQEKVIGGEMVYAHTTCVANEGRKVKTEPKKPAVNEPAKKGRQSPKQTSGFAMANLAEVRARAAEIVAGFRKVDLPDDDAEYIKRRREVGQWA